MPVRLTPLTTRLLVRLVAAEGEPVPVRRLHRDVWAVAGAQPHRTGRHRNDVQKARPRTAPRPRPRPER
ncbi:hypothetical protein LV779_31005 [Streptomyces thinghirensis]|nr:hypothetical protein [Streptomyces thinghirensis]